MSGPIANKRYFGIREVGELCGVAPHVLRHWEAEFPQLRPLRRSGNRRYYRPEDVRCAQRIRHLLYDCKYTVAGARQCLDQDASEEQRTHVLREVRGELAELLRRLDAD